MYTRACLYTDKDKTYGPPTFYEDDITIEEEKKIREKYDLSVFEEHDLEKVKKETEKEEKE